MLPDRYKDPWKRRLVGLALDRSQPGNAILDIGGADRPTLTPEQRPAGVTYVGLDPDEAVAQDAYDEFITGQIEVRIPDLLERFDVVVSWNTFEHVDDLSVAFANVHDYLKPGGWFITMFSGRWAAFSVASRILPHAVRVELMRRLMGVKPEHHFPVRYNRCSYRQITRTISNWSEPVVVPLYNGAGYFKFSPLLQRAYLIYENWTLTHPNLATHYLVIARRPPLVSPPNR
jgi:SAM-dependent methyltransferase